jgi:hypothetical protein
MLAKPTGKVKNFKALEMIGVTGSRSSVQLVSKISLHRARKVLNLN